MLGFEDSVVGSSPSPPPPPSCLVSDPETKQKWYHGSGFPKQERSAAISGCTEQQGDWRASKVAKTDEYYYCFSGSKAMQQQQNRIPLLRSNTTLFSDGQQMLSFSSPNSSNSGETATLPNYYHHPTSNAYSRNNNTGTCPFFLPRVLAILVFTCYIEVVVLKGCLWVSSSEMGLAF